MLYTDAKHWRDRAAETLQLASDTREEWSRWRLVQIAVGYNRLATNLEERAEKSGSDGTHGR
jgi:hypothetical protein